MFDRLEIPTPFQVGPVNAYVAGRTLVDPGPDSETSWAALLEALEARDLAPADVERVLVTHPHPDHFGLAARLREDGAEVVASPGAAGVIGDFDGHLDHEQAFFVDFLARHGLADDAARTVTQLPEAYLEYAPSVSVDRELDDGDAVDVAGRTVTATAVEGHAIGELLFEFDADGESDGGAGDGRTDTGDDAGNATDPSRHAIVGDHVLPDITPNPLLQPPPGSGGERPRVLPAYNRSLARTRDAGYDRLLPGHREEIPDPADRVATILEEHEERSANVREVVAGEGPVTAAEVMTALFGDLPMTEQFPGMSEAVGHLDVLEERGVVAPRERGGLVVYELAE